MCIEHSGSPPTIYVTAASSSLALKAEFTAGLLSLVMLLRTCILLSLAGSMGTTARAGYFPGLTDPPGKAVAGAVIRLFHRSGAPMTETAAGRDFTKVTASRPSSTSKGLRQDAM